MSASSMYCTLSGVRTAADIDRSLKAFDGAIKAMLAEGVGSMADRDMSEVYYA